jgi:hypothetical protein
MYIEDRLPQEVTFEIRKLNWKRSAVYHSKAVCVFIGPEESCREYIQDQMSKQFKRGANPDFTR